MLIFLFSLVFDDVITQRSVQDEVRLDAEVDVRKSIVECVSVSCE